MIMIHVIRQIAYNRFYTWKLITTISNKDENTEGHGFIFDTSNKYEYYARLVLVIAGEIAIVGTLSTALYAIKLFYLERNQLVKAPKKINYTPSDDEI